jgi:ADP-heptose:LPS heptosyltransferase
LARMVCCLRDTPPARTMHGLLMDLGFHNENQLLAGYHRLLHEPPLSRQAMDSIRQILLPSRITIGADVVITGVLAQRLARAMPQAEIVVAGPAHIPRVFYATPRLRHLPLAYERHGSMTNRITVWADLYCQAAEERRRLNPNEFLVVDTDSRLTQLGLLPLVGQGATRLFPSRQDVAGGASTSLPELANRWCDHMFGPDEHVWPTVSFAPSHLEAARRYVAGRGNAFFLVISLGVGNNEAKRVPAPFEKDLLLSLLQENNTLILLDSGTQKSGMDRVEGLLDACQSHAFATAFLHEDELASKQPPFRHGVVGFRGTIGALGALIGQADGFFGYDSCCQHIASALNTPSVIAFAGAPNTRFQDRWRSQGSAGRTATVAVPPGTAWNNDTIHFMVRQVSQHFHQLRT